MALWGKNDQANNAPKYRVIDKFVSGQNKDGMANAYNNAVHVSTQLVTVAGVDVAEAHAKKGVTHPGWVVIRQGTGPVKTIAASGGTGYSNTDAVKVSNGSVNAAATIVTNSTGGSLVVTVTNGGNGFINATSLAIAVANSTGGASAGSGATFTVTLGGRAGRVHFETLVAMGTITGDGADDAILPP